MSGLFGFMLAVPIRLAQTSRTGLLAMLSRGFTTTIRGTPLLVQVYLIYYGVGDLLSHAGHPPELPLALPPRRFLVCRARLHHQRRRL